MGRRQDGYKSRRSLFARAHLKRTVCAMEHFFTNSMRSCTRKRSLDSRERSYVMAEKKPRPANLICNMTSVKSRSSKEMVNHKFCTADNLKRNVISHAEKPRDIEFPKIRSRRSSRINKKDTHTFSATNGSKLTSSMATFKRSGSSSYEGFTEDWTQEHLLEPRKTEKRKRLDELHTPDGATLVAWGKESNRKIRKLEVDTCGIVGKRPGKSVLPQSKAGPVEELQRSYSSSESGGINDLSDAEKNEKVCARIPSDNHASTANIHKSSCVGQVGRRWTSDLPGAVCKEHFPGEAHHLPFALKDSNRSPDDGSYKEVSNGVKASSSHCMLLGERFDHSGVVKLHSEDEIITNIIAGGRQVDMLAVLQQKELGEKCLLQENEQGEVRVKSLEGKKCGLCGGDNRGEPAEYLIPVSNETKDGQTSKTCQNSTGYSEWDAFGNEPGWLGPLLGPLGDRFGIAGVWVHQECAIWSPEVYFSGVGRIKNIRTALRRGKLLKCSRCMRPGATIGCRIARCPRTYHLPCARFEGCYFDHKKFLMACYEHLHRFLPRLPGGRNKRRLNMEQIRLRRRITEWKKTAQKAAQLDAETEEKWQEKTGIDEEFLRREWRRLQRDIARVAPVMVGGGSKACKLEGWESIAGLDNVIQCMKEMVMLPLLYPEAFAKLSVLPPRGVLLHGHPGTGKTLAVRALVGACTNGPKQIAYFSRKGADCLGKYAGDAERQLRILFHLAEKHQPSIIFFDEIDGLAPTRSQHQDQTQKSVVSTLLALMDGIKSRGSVVVIGATNRPDALDPALRRPGRFDREIYFPLPSFCNRTAILTLLTNKWQIPFKQEVISLIASKTVGFAGADLQALCAQAAINSLKRRVSVDNLMSLAQQQCQTPCLPDLRVTAVDWATALGQISPPCSWRSAKAGINMVICAPVPHYILPVLLWPMVELIMLLHLDCQVVLPPVLNRLASMLEETLQVHLGDSWIALLNARAISSRVDLEEALENKFSMVGMVCNWKIRSASSIVQNAGYKGSKFRVMLSGKERVWLDYFAGWFLFGFEGFAEMCNINLTTMLQEGGGDVVQGLIQIFGNIQNKSPCVIYMPQLESWAVESVPTDQVQQKTEPNRQASQCWNIFIQLVNQLSSNLQLIFVASSQMQKEEVPHDVLNFFWKSSPSTSSINIDTPGGPLIREKRKLHGTTSPCLWIAAPPGHDMVKVFSRAANFFAGLLVQELLCNGQLENTIDPSHSTKKVSVSEVPENSSPSKWFTDAHTRHEADIGCSSSKVTTRTHAAGNKAASVSPPDYSFLRFAISMIGYELLYHPELRDLRHATSRLLEGPCYNARLCMGTSSEMVDNNSGDSNHLLRTGSLKGLKAVGLLAYEGNYWKAKDVAEGIDEVVTLLMKQISVKISLGKDRSQFLHLCHKAASLRDKIFLWAYNLRRFDLASSKLQGNTLGFSVLDSKDHEENATSTAKIILEIKKVELPLKALVPTPEMISQVEAVCAGKVDAQLQASQETNVIVCNKAELAFPVNPPRTQNVHKGLGFIDDRAMEELDKGREEQQKIEDSMAEKHFHRCLKKVRKSLRRLFMRVWKSRGSTVSLNIADNVIGTCASAVSMELLKCGLLGLTHAADSATRTGCVCGASVKRNKELKEIASFNSKSSKGIESFSTQENKPLNEPNSVCLCLLLKVISELKI